MMTRFFDLPPGHPYTDAVVTLLWAAVIKSMATVILVIVAITFGILMYRNYKRQDRILVLAEQWAALAKDRRSDVKTITEESVGRHAEELKNKIEEVKKEVPEKTAQILTSGSSEGEIPTLPRSSPLHRTDPD